jgi:hypothetical protein
VFAVANALCTAAAEGTEGTAAPALGLRLGLRSELFFLDRDCLTADNGPAFALALIGDASRDIVGDAPAELGSGVVRARRRKGGGDGERCNRAVNDGGGALLSGVFFFVGSPFVGSAPPWAAIAVMLVRLYVCLSCHRLLFLQPIDIIVTEKELLVLLFCKRKVWSVMSGGNIPCQAERLDCGSRKGCRRKPVGGMME